MDADLRLNSQSFWRVLVFALNAILFVLVGLQFPEILRTVGHEFSPGEIIGYGLLVSAVVVAVRVVWQFLPVSLGRILPALGDTGGGEDWRERLLIGWSGMRGAVSLAAALALPFTLDSGAPFDSRDLIVYLTVAVIFVTLVGQGLTLPSLVSWLGLSSSGPWAPDEAVARLAAAQAALDRLDELEADGTPVPENALARLRELYQARFARSVERSRRQCRRDLDRGPAHRLPEAARGPDRHRAANPAGDARRRPHQAGPLPPHPARPRSG